MPVTFNAARQQYRAPSGRYVAPSIVRDLVEQDLDLSRDRMQDIARQYQDGDISRVQFRQYMRKEIATLHTAHSVAGYGGYAQMTPSRWGSIGRKVQDQHKFLEGMIAAEEDKDYLASEAFIHRAGSYSGAAIHSYEAARKAGMVEHGYDRVRNVEDAEAQHCKGEGSCPEQTAKGWVHPDNMVLPGQRLCQNSCRCDLEYSKGD